MPVARVPFNKTRPITKKQLERVHRDVCGPMDTETIGGYRYFVTFTDDFTHLTEMYVIKRINQIFSVNL